MSNTVKMVDDICIINDIEYHPFILPERCYFEDGNKLYHIRNSSNFSYEFQNNLSVSNGNYVYFHLQNVFLYGKILYLGVGNTFYIIKEQYFDEY